MGRRRKEWGGGASNKLAAPTVQAPRRRSHLPWRESEVELAQHGLALRELVEVVVLDRDPGAVLVGVHREGVLQVLDGEVLPDGLREEEERERRASEEE